MNIRFLSCPLFIRHAECSPKIFGHNEVMTKPATVISTSIRGEICFKFRDFSPGIPGFEMTP